jgi:uncharacterized protein YycO
VTDLEIPYAPPSTHRWFPAGEHCTDAMPGDLVLVRGGGYVDGVIRLGERLPAAGQYAFVNHAAITLADDQLSEQEAKGNKVVPLAKYQAVDYVVVQFQIGNEQRSAVVDLAKACSRDQYGWPSIVGITFDIITGARLSIGVGSRMICSTMAAYCLVAGGLRPDKDLDAVLPSDLMRWCKVAPP